MTQCLAAAGCPERPWLLCVAAPGVTRPVQSDLRAFQIPPGVGVKLHVGTWHAGPLFDGAQPMDFFNLELADTNVVDHVSCSYTEQGTAFEVLPAVGAPPCRA